MKKITNWEEETEARVARGVAYFKEGYNCAQSVARAFADMYDVPDDLITLMSASFGAGMGRMRETCGTASGMFMVAGLETASVEVSQEIKALNEEYQKGLTKEEASVPHKAKKLTKKQRREMNKQNNPKTVCQL